MVAIERWLNSRSGRLACQPAVFAAIFLVALLAWSYRGAAAMLAARWWTDADYVYGFLVPVFSVTLLWIRRRQIPALPWEGSLWGLALLAVAAMMRWISAYFFFALLDPLSLVPCLAGLVLFVGGWRMLRWSGPSIVFLAFMVPLPGFVAGWLSHPLLRIGTTASTFLLQTAGVPAVAQGNIILLPDTRLNVIEACSGLRMMMLFFAVCTGAVFLIRRPWVDKAVILFSAIPIAVVANVIRITVTGLLQEWLGYGLTDYHALAGCLMMPLAVLLLWAEMSLLSMVLIVEEDLGPLFAPRPRQRATSTSSRRRRR